ncbi:MAG: hypothetical protein QM767_09815 [Anaeromyxobacter sp.]
MRARLNVTCPAPLRLAALLLAATAGCATTQAAKVPAAPAGCNLAFGRSRTMVVSPLGEVGKKVIPLTCSGKPYAELEIYLGDEKHCRSLAVKYAGNNERVWLVRAPRLDPDSPIDWSPGNERENQFYHVYDVKPAGDGRAVAYREGNDAEVFDVLDGKKR